MNRSHMRNVTLLLFVGVLSISASHAQLSPEMDYLVLQSGDTLVGEVAHIAENGVGRDFYRKIRIRTLAGKKKKFHRQDVRAFRSDGQVYEQFRLSQHSNRIVLVNPKYDMDPSGERYFLRQISKGALNHYALEWFEQGEATLYSMDLIQKEGDMFLMRANQGLLGLKKKVVSEYLYNCSDLVEKVNKQDLTNVTDVVAYYNYHCGY